MRTIFDLCEPRDDVLSGRLAEAEFAADLAQVIDRRAPDEYQKPDIFFANTHPTHGLKDLLKNVALRLANQGSAASIFRLDTQYGGGKTHSLIALVHLAGGCRGSPTLMSSLTQFWFRQARLRLPPSTVRTPTQRTAVTWGKG